MVLLRVHKSNNDTMTIPQPKIAVVDVDLGNLFSVIQALTHCRAKAWRTRRPDEIAAADGVVLPGVGAFGDAMAALVRQGIDEALRDLVRRRVPVLGVCLGMQLLFERSFEFGRHKGLGLLEGEVLPLRDAVVKGTKVPNIGWSACHLTGTGERHGVLGDMAGGCKMYFVHSYYALAGNHDDILATASYGGLEFCAAAGGDRLFGVQFHPEKSADQGLALYRRFSQLCAAPFSDLDQLHDRTRAAQ